MGLKYSLTIMYTLTAFSHWHTQASNAALQMLWYFFLVPNKKNTTVGYLIKEAAANGIFMGLLYRLISADIGVLADTDKYRAPRL